MNKKDKSLTGILAPIGKIIICGYILYIFFFEKNLRRHTPMDLDGILMLMSAIWLVSVISDSLHQIKNDLKTKKK
ncbi:MAG: hypothetical protein Q3971_01340 [Moraxella sp.]|nr:hypothetical protein [Moraxella sp.]